MKCKSKDFGALAICKECGGLAVLIDIKTGEVRHLNFWGRVRLIFKKLA